MNQSEIVHLIQDLFKSNETFPVEFITLLQWFQNVTSIPYTFSDVYSLVNFAGHIVQHEVTQDGIKDIVTRINGSDIQTTESFYKDFYHLLNSNALGINDFEFYTGAIIGIIVLILIILIIGLNIYLLGSLYWLKGKEVSTTLKISLSMAVADLYAATLYGGGLIVQYVAILVYKKYIGVEFFLIYMAICFGAFLMALFHLIALTTNHYVGILWPLRYKSVATKRNINILLTLIWILPVVLMFPFYFFMNTDSITMLKEKESLSSMVLTRFLEELPLAIIAYMYIHILIAIQIRRKAWAKLEASGGGYRHCGTERQNFEKDVKVIHTTLIIFGTFLLCFVPHIIVIELTPYIYRPATPVSKPAAAFKKIAIVMYICKPLTNPIIYAIRMPEIKEATFKMRQAVRKIFTRRIAPHA